MNDFIVIQSVVELSLKQDFSTKFTSYVIDIESKIIALNIISSRKCTYVYLQKVSNTILRIISSHKIMTS